MAKATENDALESPFSKTVNLLQVGWTVIEKGDLKMTQNKHVYAIGSRSEVADDVVSGEDVETFWEYVSVNLLVASFSSFWENWIGHLYDA